MGLPARTDFLGQGWNFPPTFSKQAHSVALVSDVEDIRQSLLILFQTAPGERVMLPTYGCDLWRFVFRDVSASFLSEIKDAVSTAILRWEPRIDLLGVEATADRLAGLVLIEVDFRVRKTNTRSNLVYPFYLREGTLTRT
jgi:phage baseplate assembly protein W